MIFTCSLFCTQHYVPLNPLSLSCPSPSFTPLVTTSLFSMSVSPFLFAIFTIWLYFLDSTHKWDYTVFAFVWVIALSIIHSNSIHIVENSKRYYVLWKAWSSPLGNSPAGIKKSMLVITRHIRETHAGFWSGLFPCIGTAPRLVPQT